MKNITVSVLYVDDEPGLLTLAKTYLERNGEFSVDTLTTAQSALKQLTTVSYDAIISDYQMPKIDGIKFLIEVRSTLGDIPFILFTGRGREDVVIEAINNGADFYLQKGGDPKSQFAELTHKIKKAVEQRQAEKALKGSEQRLSDIINFLPDATFAIDLSGTVIAWNQAMEEMTGVPQNTIIGTGDYSYALPFYSERRPLLLDLVLRNDEKLKKNILMSSVTIKNLSLKYLSGTCTTGKVPISGSLHPLFMTRTERLPGPLNQSETSQNKNSLSRNGMRHMKN